MPPLRERREDMPLLVEHFVQRFAERTGKKIDGVDEKAMTELTRYEWPGNVRELENTIERAVVLSHRAAAQQPDRLADERDRHAADGRGAVAQAASEPRVGRARDHAPRARAGARRQEGRRRADGHQPARAQPLPRQVPHRRLTLTPSVSAYAKRNDYADRDARSPFEFCVHSCTSRPGIDLAYPQSSVRSLTFFKDSVAAAGTALLLGAAAMSHQQDPAAASAPFDSGSRAVASRTLAQDEPRTIEVVAKRFAFEPARIEVTEGERVRLVVKSGDGVHGVEIKKFKVNKKVPRGGDR